MPTKHKHAELIHAWADGAEIEYLLEGLWHQCDRPIWHDDYEYRIKDPYRHLKEAAADPNKQVRVNSPEHVGEWDSTDGFSWMLSPEEYEIRDKPKPKKVKMWQWVIRARDGKTIYLSPSFHKDPPELYGVIQRALWTEIEVEE